MLELLVALALFGLLLTGFIMFLMPTLKAMGRATAQTEVQQQALLAFERIERELRTSGSTGVQVFPQSLVGAGRRPGLSLTPLKGVDGKGQPNWANSLVAVWWNAADQRLRLKSWPPKNPPSFVSPPQLSEPAQLSLDEFESLAASNNGSEVNLAAGVISFDVLHGGANSSSLVPPLTLQIELERQVGHEYEKFKIHKVITLRTL